MNREVIEINSEHTRGAQVRCKDCREEDDPVLWKTLFLATREPGRQLSGHDKRMVDIVADGHLKDNADHNVVIFLLKKLTQW